ncbi:MAG: terminase large subunit [Rhodospirillales bacterium]|nr:terminase large subunit [Rhodospirillales bacterium]
MGGRSLVPDLPLFKAETARALRVFNRLRIPDVIGTPTMADACGDWFRDIVAAMLGSYDAAAGRRMIQEAFLLVPKKNSKSSNGGALMVAAAIVNQRPNAEGLLIAPTKEIANISFKQASGIIKLDPELDKRFHIQTHIRTITQRVTGASIQIKAADTDTITGSKSTYVLIDETHVFSKRKNAAELMVEIRGALAARPDGFLIQITTQSKDPPAGVFLTELNTARAVRDGEIDLPLLAVLYELPDKVSEDGGWEDEATWPLVNPNMGRSLDKDFLRRELMKAKREGKAALSLLASQHFNVEIGMKLRSDRWVGADYWELRADQDLTLEELISRSEVIVVGIDGGGLDDLLGFAVIGREVGTQRWLLWNRAWAHSDVLERRKSEAPTLLDFEKAGDLVMIDELPDDLTAVAALVQQVNDSGMLAGVGLDPIGIGGIVDVLAEIGIEEARRVGIPQGFKLANSIKTTERKLADRTLVHAGQPMMTWCVGNAKVEPRGNAILITKQSSGTAKIDPLMATFNAVALMSTNPEPPQGRSVYNDPDQRPFGFLTI